MLSAIFAYLFPPEEASSSIGPRRVRVGKADELQPGEGRLALVEDEPVWVVNLTQDFVGVSAWCTHKKCIVRWQQDRKVFTCPCHEGLFDERGNVVSGLPLRPLNQFRVGLVNGDLYVSRPEREA